MDRRGFLKFGSLAAGAFSLASCGETGGSIDKRQFAGGRGANNAILPPFEPPMNVPKGGNGSPVPVLPVEPETPGVNPPEQLAPPTAEPIYTRANPGKWAGKEATHLPTLSILAEKIIMKTPHPMAADHFISRHQIKAEDGSIIADRIIKPTDLPESNFSIPKPDGKNISAFSTCNLHGIWQEDFPILSLAAGFMAEPLYTAEKPGKWTGKEATHLAVLKSSTVLPNGMTRVVVETPGHVMTAEHYISRHEIRNRQGDIIASNLFKVGTDMTALSTLELAMPVGALKLYSYCNLHGIWMSTVAFDQAANVYTTDKPGPVGAPAAHIPTATTTDISTVGVPKSLTTVTNVHEMTAGTHYIYKHQIQSSAGTILAENNIYITPGLVLTAATSYFEGRTFQQSSDSFGVYAYCNLHGIWKSNLTFEQANIIYTTTPGPAGGGAATHVPTVVADATTITVTTPHAMAPDHFISKHQLRDATGKLLGERSFSPTSSPVSQYPKSGVTGMVAAYSFCNLHGIWKGTGTV
jgi:superoxide reductase